MKLIWCTCSCISHNLMLFYVGWVGAELSLDVTQLEKLWHKGPDFVKGGTPIPLIFRVATVSLHLYLLQHHMASLVLMAYTAFTTLRDPLHCLRHQGNPAVPRHESQAARHSLIASPVV